MTQPSITLSHVDTPERGNHARAIRLWLFAVAALVFVLVIVGGATRMTESGLSITEWRPATGIIPPFSEPAWQAEFEKYQTIPQYTQRNFGMTLSAFKTIYWWEWTHRFLARLVGVAFLLPFLFFLWRGWIGRDMAAKLAVIFGLGALQGAVGWWMVASGLSERTSVSQYRLAVHLTLASLIFAALIWAALRIGEKREGSASVPARLRWGGRLLLILVFFQIYLGALVAGLRAGLSYNTWPLIDGAFIPDAERMLFETPLWRNFFENTLTVQFNHRMMAYTLLIVAILHAIDMARNAPYGAATQSAIVLCGAITVQALVGIFTLLTQAPIDLALIHQAVAMGVLAVAVVHTVNLTPPRAPVPGRR
ncbi:MAG TPA: COX15/CtaA family protein [Xanthobacteraceae bacterium]|nr:COX15/CtaA family protein [Xanthobacteraceae bacterium]